MNIHRLFTNRNQTTSESLAGSVLSLTRIGWCDPGGAPHFDGPASVTPSPLMILVSSRVITRLLTAFSHSVDIPSFSPITEFQTFRNPSQEPVMTRPSGGYTTVETKRSYPSRGLGVVLSGPRSMTVDTVPLNTRFLHLRWSHST